MLTTVFSQPPEEALLEEINEFLLEPESLVFIIGLASAIHRGAKPAFCKDKVFKFLKSKFHSRHKIDLHDLSEQLVASAQAQRHLTTYFFEPLFRFMLPTSKHHFSPTKQVKEIRIRLLTCLARTNYLFSHPTASFNSQLKFNLDNYLTREDHTFIHSIVTKQCAQIDKENSNIALTFFLTLSCLGLTSYSFSRHGFSTLTLILCFVAISSLAAFVKSIKTCDDACGSPEMVSLTARHVKIFDRRGTLRDKIGFHYTIKDNKDDHATETCSDRSQNPVTFNPLDFAVAQTSQVQSRLASRASKIKTRKSPAISSIPKSLAAPTKTWPGSIMTLGDEKETLSANSQNMAVLDIKNNFWGKKTYFAYFNRRAVLQQLPEDTQEYKDYFASWSKGRGVPGENHNGTKRLKPYVHADLFELGTRIFSYATKAVGFHKPYRLLGTVAAQDPDTIVIDFCFHAPGGVGK